MQERAGPGRRLRPAAVVLRLQYVSSRRTQRFQPPELFDVRRDVRSRHPRAIQILQRKGRFEMASIAQRDDGRWRARYRDARGKQHACQFSRKIDAQRWLDALTLGGETGNYVDPATGRVAVGFCSQRWLLGQLHIRRSTYQHYAAILRAHIQPRWHDVALADVTHADVQDWATTLSATTPPATTRKAYFVLSRVLALAVNDGRIVRNPAAGVNLPRVFTATHRPTRAAPDVHDESP
jgi:hypothetical protein